jgi:VIT1/CCC1 family predicted Fe2+/Mn2+ transporter
MTTHEPQGTPADRARWKRYLADERAEAAVYRELAARRDGEEREILLALAAAEGRHEAHWLALLDGDDGGMPRADIRTRLLAGLARRFGSIFVLALAQRAESRSPYSTDPHATAAMAADERIHGEVVRGLAARGRRRLAGTFRAAVFGANDGLVSNLALVLGIGATGVPAPVVLFTGIAGLLAGALSMGAGEYVSVRSQRELLEASAPDPGAREALVDLDIDANELALVYRARGMAEQDAVEQAALVVARVQAAGRTPAPTDAIGVVEHDDEAVGTGMSAAISSFLFFASGALIPVLPWIFGMSGTGAILIATVLVSIALLLTGATVGLLSGASPLKRALRQLAIGLGAAAVTYLLGLAFGTTIG